jgi:SsrA-binding protein
MRLVNKKAKRDYQIIDEIEAGIVLSGAEVKSLRSGRGRLSEAFARVNKGEVWLYNLLIPPYQQSVVQDYNPSRARKLLLVTSKGR